MAVRIVEAAQEQLRGRELEVPSELVMRAVDASRCPACDCEFVTLARELGVPLRTSDRQILRDLPDVAVPLARP